MAALPDPVGRILDERTRPNGLKLQKISTPIGVVVIIYESRPNVTADAASLCFKSGNATILRGGKEALNSNQLIAKTMIEAGRKTHAAFPEHAIQVVPTPDREAIPDFALAHAIRGFVHAARRRGFDPRRGRVQQSAGDQTLQRRVPRLCGCGRGLEDGGGDRDERQSASARRFAMRWKPCWWTKPWPEHFFRPSWRELDAKHVELRLMTPPDAILEVEPQLQTPNCER